MKFKSQTAEAEAIEKMLASDIAKRLKTYDPARLAAFRADGMRCAIDLRILGIKQGDLGK